MNDLKAKLLDHPLAGWFVLDVFRQSSRGWDWCAFMIDVDPDSEAFIEWQQWRRPARDCWVRIPGKHRSRDAAWDALEDMMATRH